MATPIDEATKEMDKLNVEEESEPEKQLNEAQQLALEKKVLVLKAGADAGFVEYAYLAPKQLKKEFSAICDTSIDLQCEYWLKSFVTEFEGKIDSVLELCEEFKAYLPDEEDSKLATHIDAFQAHVFLERKGQTLSVIELRDVMRNICAFNNVSKFSFIEYLAWSYQKTLKELFEVKPQNLEPLLKGLYEAIHAYQENKAQHDSKTDEIEEAAKQAEADNEVVKQRLNTFALKEVLTRGATRRQKDAVYHKYKQVKAQKEFEKRKKVELDEKKRIENEERKAGRARMAARMGAKET